MVECAIALGAWRRNNIMESSVKADVHIIHSYFNTVTPCDCFPSGPVHLIVSKPLQEYVDTVMEPANHLVTVYFGIDLLYMVLEKNGMLKMFSQRRLCNLQTIYLVDLFLTISQLLILFIIVVEN